MIDKYNKILTRKEFNDLKDAKLKGFYPYVRSQGGFIFNLIRYIKNLVECNLIIKDFLYKYLLDVSQNKLINFHNVKLEHQLLAKQILEKYSH